jgi:beta-lactamase regulating signal transducer with metallopeptidase domain
MSKLANADWNSILAFVAGCAIKGAIVIIIAAVVAWLLRRDSAAARHSVWTAAIIAQLLIPVLEVTLPTWRVRVIDAPDFAPSASVAPNAAGPAAKSPNFSDSRTPSPAAAATLPNVPPPVPARISTGALIAGLWLLGVLAVLLRLAVGTVIVSRIAARGQRVVDDHWLGTMQRLAVALGIRRPLILLRGDSVGVPVTWGIVYPVVFLPRDSDEWPEERRRYVLVHEMAHVKRLDAFTQLLAQVAAALFWFNPLVWLAAARMRRERENACDDYVLTHGTRASEYANDMLELVRSMGSRGSKTTAPAFAALAMARRSEFEGRMLSILDPEARRSAMSRTKLGASAVTALLVVAPLAAFSPFNDNAPVTMSPTVAAPISSGPSPRAPETKPTAGSAAALVGECDRSKSRPETSIHQRLGSDYPDGNQVQVVRRTPQPQYCYEAVIDGIVTFRADDGDVGDMGPGARLRIRERTAVFDHEVIVTKPDGQLRHAYYDGGRPATFDAAAARWFAAALKTAIRESGVDATQRVARIARESGVQGVMKEIGAIGNSGAKSIYYSTLFRSSVPMDDTQMGRAFRQAGVDLGSSSSDLMTTLIAGMSRRIRGEARQAFADASARVESDGDKAAVITQAAMTADRELLLGLARAARTIDSDGDKSRLLIAVAARYLVPGDSALVTSYFNVVDGVGSDGDRARTLIAAAAYGHATESVTLACLRSTHAMDSDGDKVSVLVAIAERRLIVNARLRDAFMAATNRVDSDGDRARALKALASVGSFDGSPVAQP